MNTQVHRAIERCYDAFAWPHPPMQIYGCHHCISPQELQILVTRPLRSLSVEDLSQYASDAMTTIGTTEDFRYFWPRIAELTVDDLFPTDREIIFGKLSYGAWWTWPLPERDAINELANALSSRFTTEVFEKYEADSWLCALGSFVEDIRLHLQPLLENTEAARKNLQSIYEENLPNLRTGRLWNPFWGYGTHIVVEWLTSGEVKDALSIY